jgi:hypothetical protein
VTARLELFEEPFAPSGAADAAARDNAFGTTRLSTWERLLRETLQNSWDARQDKPGGSIAYSVALRSLSGSADHALREGVFGRRPRHHERLAAILASPDPIELLLISDRRTVGLGGPTNSAAVTAEGDPTNYKDLILNFGNDASKPYTDGGTYGIGKAVLFRASAASTCIVYSQFLDGATVRSRLIAVGSAPRFQSEGLNRTGRHFWGVTPVGEHRGAHLDPLQGDAARTLAGSLGMLDSLATDETGTVIALVAPDRGELTPRELVEQVRDAALLWAWPHMVRTGPGGLAEPSVDFSFSVDDETVPLGNPLTHPSLKHFASAFRAAERALRREEPTDSLTKVELLQRPVKAAEPPVGILAFRDVPATITASDDDSPHHGDRIALIRPTPHFVVEYFDVGGRQARDETTRGVFIVDQHHEEKFAKAEPVAHDRWDPPRRSKTNEVHFALERIRELTRPKEAGLRREAGRGSLSGLARISAELGQLMSAGTGRGPAAQPPVAPPEPSAAGGGGGRSGVQVEFEDHIEYGVIGEDRTTTFFASLAGSPNSDEWVIAATPFVVVGEGQREKSPPGDAAVATVLHWTLQDGGRIDGASRVPIAALARGRFEITIRAPRDCAVSLDLVPSREAGAG